MAEHTPGTWEWRSQMGDKTLHANGKAILYADASWMNANDGVCVSPQDARLIAAAPDLLAVCEAILKELGEPAEWKDIEPATHRRLITAITKAKGE